MADQRATGTHTKSTTKPRDSQDDSNPMGAPCRSVTGPEAEEANVVNAKAVLHCLAPLFCLVMRGLPSTAAKRTYTIRARKIPRVSSTYTPSY